MDLCRRPAIFSALTFMFLHPAVDQIHKYLLLCGIRSLVLQIIKVRIHFLSIFR